MDGEEVKESWRGSRRRKYVTRGLGERIGLGRFDRIRMLDSEINALILAIATEKMHESNLMAWPEMKSADKKKTIRSSMESTHTLVVTLKLRRITVP